MKTLQDALKEKSKEEKHFEFTDKTETLPDGTVLHQIKATKDLPMHNVKKGDVGGWIEKPENLSDNAWVYRNAWVSEDAQVSGNARVFGDARVSGKARVYGKAKVYGKAQVYGNAHIFGNVRVSGNAWVSGYAWLYGNTKVSGNEIINTGNYNKGNKK